MERIKVNNNIPAKVLRQNIDEDYKSEITECEAYKARRLANELIAGSHEELCYRVGDMV